MARGNYNGFTPEDQRRGGQLQTTAYGNGMLVREWTCWGCLVEGQEPGDIIAHLEDYTNPIDGAIWLCYRCHTILHARFDHPEAWDRYRAAIRDGHQWPLTRGYQRVMGQHCYGQSLPVGLPVNPARGETILDQIEDGLYLPPGDADEVRKRMDLIHALGIKYFRVAPPSLF